MKCPNCGKDLWFVKDVCPFCKQAIASSRESGSPGPAPVASEIDSDGEAFVTLMKCGTLGEADAVRAQLASVGIEAIIPDETMMQTVAWPMSTYGYVRVQVRSADYPAAKEFVSSLKQEPAEANELAKLPLSWAMRWFAFFMPVLVCPDWMIFAIAKNAYSAQGCERKAQELWHWFVDGVLFWIAAGVIGSLVTAWVK